MKGGARLWLELAAVIVAALALSNALAIVVLEQTQAFRVSSEVTGRALDRLAAFASLFAQLDEEERQTLLASAKVPHEAIWQAPTPAVAAEAARSLRIERAVAKRLSTFPHGEIRARVRQGRLSVLQRGLPDSLEVAVDMGSAGWLNARFQWSTRVGSLRVLAAGTGVAVAVLLAVAVWFALRFSGPLAGLSAAARAMAAGDGSKRAPVRGPHVLRQAAQAFNQMAERVSAMLTNQRVWLASIGHDLRTPLTSLRLKSEFVEDADLRAQMLASLDELSAAAEGALEAARSGIGEETPRMTDLNALVEAVCADVAEAGGEAAFEGGGELRLKVRANDLKRAVRNLVQNAVKYGRQARVRLEACAEGAGAAVIVEDEGPGLAAEDMERAFEPFVRLDESRSGFGLGLALARAVARGHGGEVRLENRAEGGLRARLEVREIP